LANGDAILPANVVGDTCYELLQRTINICDEAYTHLMKCIWAD
jgi:hypothetical protein